MIASGDGFGGRLLPQALPLAWRRLQHKSGRVGDDSMDHVAQKLFAELGVSFKTTNCLESINGLIEQRTGKIDYWKNGEQKQRWLATALLDIEPRLRRVRGYKHPPALRRALHVDRIEREAEKVGKTRHKKAA